MAKPLGAPKSLFRAYLPVELRAKMDLALVSPLEGRVPHGDYSSFLEARVREHFEWDSLDLSPYGFPGGYFVRGPREMIDRLRKHIQGVTV